MAFVTARGTRFHVVELGAGTPVVMLHGLFTGSLASWYLTVAPALAARHEVRLIDWRGHGLSERTPSGYGSTAMARDLAALTKDLPPFAVVGHSYGALVAMRFALAQPDRLTRIALVEPPLTADARPWWMRTESAGVRELVVAQQRTGGAHQTTSSLHNLLEETTVLSDLTAEPPITDSDLRSLPEIPILAVAGSRSPFRAAADRIVRARPRTRCHVLQGGHELHITAKHELTNLLVPFLDENRPGKDRLIENRMEMSDG